jgi:tRNA nucleotidyltransferase/poly(A) polymerase
MELEAILVNPNRSTGVSLLAESKLIKAILPALSFKQARLAISLLRKLPAKIDFPLALAALFADCETDSALQSLAALKLSRNHTKHVKFLLNNRGRLLNADMSLAELKIAVAEPYFDDLYELQRAIQKAKRKSTRPLTKVKQRIKALGDEELRPRPLLNGHDLIRMGAAPGPAFGQLTRELYVAQLEGTLQTKAEARQWAQKWLEKHKESN